MKIFSINITKELALARYKNSNFIDINLTTSTFSSHVGSFHAKSTNTSHLTHIDFADILSSQCTHQEMKILKILSSYQERFQNYDHLNSGPSSLDNKPLQFMAF